MSTIAQNFNKTILKSTNNYTLCMLNNTCVDDTEGTVELQRGNWQLIAIPEEGKVKDIFIDRLSTQEGVPATELIKVASAYPGHINKFLSYIPGFTSETSEHNFDLIVYDNTSREITAFWVECKEWTHRSDNIIFKWKNT